MPAAAPKMVERVVVGDAYNWTTPVPGVPGRWQHNTAARGERISVSAAEAERGEKLGFLGTIEEAVAKAAADRGATSTGPVPDEQLRSMLPEELAAYASQRPDQLDRLEELEKARPEPRIAVLDMIEDMRLAHAQAVEEAAEQARRLQEAADQEAEQRRLAAEEEARRATGGGA